MLTSDDITAMQARKFGNPYNGRTENARTENTRMENARSMLQKMPEFENTRIGKWQNKKMAE
jgi:hypothetical protein